MPGAALAAKGRGMTNRMRRTLAALGLLLPLGACAQQSAPPSAIAAPAAGPALWKVADADTTIYLFGTVHALPKDVDWLRGPVADALASAQTLVTEIAPGLLKDPATQQAFATRAALPPGQTLRGLMTAEQRQVYEAAVAKLGLPLATLDRFEPWFAALTLSTVPLLKAGYSPEAGVENAVEAKASAATRRDALETVDDQLKLFDEMPPETQMTYLIELARDIDKVGPSLSAMVAAWAKGDAEGLARLMNDEMDDPAIAERLLYARNRNWARWVETRLAAPGTVFVAVGAGHLAGANSVQDYLAKGGVAVTRVQ